MDIREAFSHPYVRLEELSASPLRVTISGFGFEEMFDVQAHKSGKKAGKIEKPVLWFREIEQGLILAKERVQQLGQVLGTFETNEWIGREISIFAGKSSQGVPMIAVGPPVGPQRPASGPRSTAAAVKSQMQGGVATIGRERADKILSTLSDAGFRLADLMRWISKAPWAADLSDKALSDWPATFKGGQSIADEIERIMDIAIERAILAHNRQDGGKPGAEAGADGRKESVNDPRYVPIGEDDIPF